MEVFAYGSLAANPPLPPRPARVRGVRRTWGVAMDNRVELPGYKVYEDPASGERPAVFVAFLDLEDDPGGAVDGVLLDVDDAQLAALDDRERNYDRVEVAVEGGGRAWAYRGSVAGRARLAEGLRTGTAVVDAGYLEAVAGLPGDAPPCPVRRLRRVGVPR